VQVAALAHRCQVQIAVEHFNVGVGLNLAAHHFAGLIDGNAHRFEALAHDLERNLLQVEDDVGGVLDHARNGAELMLHAFDANCRDGRAFDGAEQDAAQAIADSSAAAALKRLGRKHAIPFRQGLGIGNQSFRFLKSFEHR
jgi:hypothetical protein